ncbi:MAG: hypothetical protein ACI38U_15075 [Corynebacterium sp.]|uniref:hypothetical protein n=1 Tax=unclassified Corynebacterium TaxID=2624378 RepID=UPI0011151749|nr:hypothetical protein [Corynebacterium sp. CNJ-954]
MSIRDVPVTVMLLLVRGDDILAKVPLLLCLPIVDEYPAAWPHLSEIHVTDQLLSHLGGSVNDVITHHHVQLLVWVSAVDLVREAQGLAGTVLGFGRTVDLPIDDLKSVEQRCLIRDTCGPGRFSSATDVQRSHRGIAVLRLEL